MATSTVKKVVQPSKFMNFSRTVPVEKSLYRESNYENPDWWNSENAYLGDMAADPAATAVEKPWYDKLIDIYGAYKAQQIALKQQDQLARENAARASTGKPPLDMSDYMKYNAPQVNVGLSTSTQNLLMYGGIGLAGVLVLMMVMKNRR